MYTEFCAHAATDAATFAEFRRAPIYERTLEHVSRADGEVCLDIVRRDNPHLLEYARSLHRNDSIGMPHTFEYGSLGPIAPTTLRYFKVLSDLERLFTDLSGLRVVEIGVGYGGQCALITDRWAVAAYALVDLDGPLSLAKRYLATRGVRARLEYMSASSVTAGDYDLCISNYSFSELSKLHQQEYLSKVVSRSARGYMACNFVSGDFGIDSMTRAELAASLPGSQWLREEPQTHPGNGLLVWGTAYPATEPA